MRVRISGNEPTIGWEHLIDVLARIPKDLLFILETNGILLGADPDYAEDLSVPESPRPREPQGDVRGGVLPIDWRNPRGFPVAAQCFGESPSAESQRPPRVHDELQSPRERLRLEKTAAVHSSQTRGIRGGRVDSLPCRRGEDWTAELSVSNGPPARPAPPGTGLTQQVRRTFSAKRGDGRSRS